MARIVKEEEYAGKRNAILDVAQQLIYTRGYEQMTIQDMLDGLRISKGAFYHYFDSKQAVLEALVERMGEEVVQLLLPIVHDPVLGALEKLRRFFPTLARWKTARKDFILALMHILYADENALFRQKARTLAVKRVTPLMTTVIRQGVREGVLTTAYPDQVSEVVISLVLDFGDALAGLLLSWKPERDESLRVERTVAAYTETLERALGAPTGSLPLVDDQTLKEWFVSPGDNEAETKS
jgi:TetR/AcrR family transcriptional repressor of nem operon